MHITVDVNVNATELSNAILSLAGVLSMTTKAAPVIPSFGQGEQTESKSNFTVKIEDIKKEIAPIDKLNTAIQNSMLPEKVADSTQPATQTDPGTDPVPVITLEQVRGKLAGLSQSGKQAEVKALITKFGVNKLTDIPKENYPELLAAAEAIA